MTIARAHYATPMNESGTDRTPEEQHVIDVVAERKGTEYAERHAKLILLDARRVGIIEQE